MGPQRRKRRCGAALAGLGLLGVLLLLGGCTELRRRGYEPADRDEWQQPDRVVASLAIAPGSHVADIGSGGGYFTYRLAEAVGPTGRVYAVDIDEGLLRYVADQARERGLTQIETRLAEPDAPGLPASGVDLVFVSNTFHHLPDPAVYFRGVRAALRNGARVAVVEYDDSGWFARVFGHSTRAETIHTQMQSAGYRLLTQHDFLERQHFLVFEPAP